MSKKLSDYDNYVIINGKILPYYPRQHQKQLEEDKVYRFHECIDILKERRRK